MSHPIKVKTHGEAVLQSVIFAGLITVVIFIAPFILTLGFFTPILLSVAGTLIIFGFLFSAGKLTGTTPMNQVDVLMDTLLKSKRTVSDGIYFKLPWEVVSYKVNLETTTVCDLEENMPTNDGSVKIKALVTVKPDYSGDDKSHKIINFVAFTEEARKKALASTAKAKIRSRVSGITSVQAMAKTGSSLLNPNDFTYVAHQMGVRIEKAEVNDLDLSQAVQDARDSKARASALAEVARILVNEGGFTQEAAMETATLLDVNIDNSKKIYEVKGIDPKLFAALDGAIQGVKAFTGNAAGKTGKKSPNVKKTKK